MNSCDKNQNFSPKNSMSKPCLLCFQINFTEEMSSNKMPEQYSLKWNNFHANLTTGFHGLFEDEDLVDVSLAVEGKIIQAHKVILSVCSPYFKSLFRVSLCLLFNVYT